MHREEPGQCVMSVLRSSLSELLDLRPDNRSGAHDGGRHFCRVVALLVPWQQVTGEAQCQDDLHQDQAEPEVDFARRFVGSVDDHLDEVNRQQHRHRLRSEVMDASHQPAQEHFFLNEVHAFPRRLSTRAVGRPQENPGDDLNGKREDQRAAPDVSPAGSAGDAFVKGLFDQIVDAGSIVEPGQECAHHIETFSLIAPRNFSYFTHTVPSSFTATSSASIPRGGISFCFPPSRSNELR